MSEIQYRLLDGFPGYRIGSDGSIWSCKTMGGNLSDKWRPLKIVVGRDGYAQVSLCIHSKTIVRHVHRLVLDAFVGPRPVGMECCHADGNPMNCRLGNLRWDTSANNESDKINHGTSMHGTLNPNVRLSVKAVLTARQLRAAGLSLRKIAQHLGCARSTIHDALRGLSWKHL